MRSILLTIPTKELQVIWLPVGIISLNGRLKQLACSKAGVVELQTATNWPNKELALQDTFKRRNDSLLGQAARSNETAQTPSVSSARRRCPGCPARSRLARYYSSSPWPSQTPPRG